MRITVQKQILCWLIAVCTMFFILLTLSSLVISDLRRTQLQSTHSIMGVFTHILDDFRSTADALNRLEYTDCTDANLLAMQRALFLSKFIKSIGFLKDGLLVCTTDFGRLSTPYRQPSPDYQDSFGDTYWYKANLLIFDEKVSGFIVRRNRYDAVLNLDSLYRQAGSSAYQWEILYTHQQSHNHVAGDPGIAHQQLSTNVLDKLLSNYATACSKEYPFYCLTTYQSTYQLIEHNLLMFALTIVISMIVGGLASYSSYRLFKRRLSVEYRVKQGLKNDAFYWLFQPIVDLKTERIVGCEALARFEDQHGPLYPDTFIPAIKSTGLRWPFTVKMFQVALNELTTANTLPDQFYMSFNIFPSNFVGPQIRELVTLPEVINSRHRIMLEIVEDERLENREAQNNLEFLHQHGFLIAIDDFGTGYSNLGELKKIKSDVLKIDRSFVTDIEVQSIRSSLIPYIVDIANQVQVAVIAEGIENQQQRQALLRMGVSLGQGWAFGKPMPIGQLVDACQPIANQKTRKSEPLTPLRTQC